MEVRIPKALLIVLALIGVGGGCGAVGYLIGKGATDEDEIREEAFAEGEDAEREKGEDAERETGYDAVRRRTRRR